jgi:hypothetical protein
MGAIKTFRGLMASATQDTIVLHTNDGSTGYRIVKFEIILNEPGGSSYESIVKIYKVEQSTIATVIDFSDTTLLAAAFQAGNSNATVYPVTQVVIFDGEIFNQDIYVTHATTGSVSPMNYIIELEQMPLDLNESTVATLKDIRNTRPD